MIKRVSSSTAIFLAATLFASQASAAYLETLSLSGPKAVPINVSLAGMQRPSVSVLLAANSADAAEAEDLDALSADQAGSDAANSKKQPAQKPAGKPANKADKQTAAAATINKGDICRLNKECGRGEVCIDGYCVDKDDVDEATLDRAMKYNLDGKHWAFWGGLTGHLLWGTGAIVLLASADPTPMQVLSGWGLYTSSTIVSTIAANSAIDNVGVFGGPGQKLGSWLFFAVGIPTLAVAELLAWGKQKVKEELENDPNFDPEDLFLEWANQRKVGPTIFILTLPSMFSGVLMSSVAMRANRQVRHVKRRAERKERKQASQPETSMRFDVVPYISGTDHQMTGAIGQWTLRF